MQNRRGWKGVIYNGIDYSQFYEISNLGKLRSSKTKHIEKLQPIDGGYLGYCGSVGHRKQNRMFRIHKCVAEAFLDNSNKFPCVNHIDGNKHNNFIDNLEWCTYQENTIHAFKIGLIDIKSFSGENAGCAKLTNKQVDEIRELYKTGNYTHRSLGKLYNINHGTITKIINNQRYINQLRIFYST